MPVPRAAFSRSVHFRHVSLQVLQADGHTLQAVLHALEFDGYVSVISCTLQGPQTLYYRYVSVSHHRAAQEIAAPGEEEALARIGRLAALDDEVL